MKKTDHRTQLYLTNEQYQALRRLAGTQGESLAGVVREAVDAYVAAAAATVDWEGDPLNELVGSLQLPPIDGDDLNEAIDRSLYDDATP